MSDDAAVLTCPNCRTAISVSVNVATGASDRTRHLTIDEVAVMLRTPVATLRYWRHLGTGPRSFKLGRRVLYASSDVEAWLETSHG